MTCEKEKPWALPNSPFNQCSGADVVEDNESNDAEIEGNP